MLPAITEAAKSHKKAARCPPCLLAGLSLMSTERSPHFSRSAAAQGWTLPGDPKQPPADLSHLLLQTVPHVGTAWNQVSVSNIRTPTGSYTVSVTAHIHPFSITSIRECPNVCREFPFSLALSESLFISFISIFYSTFKTSLKMTLTLLLIATALELNQPCWSPAASDNTSHSFIYQLNSLITTGQERIFLALWAYCARLVVWHQLYFAVSCSCCLPTAWKLLTRFIWSKLGEWLNTHDAVGCLKDFRQNFSI